ncbi:hypothetical protein JCM8208_003468 [Rhodotorula glutinis]
MLSGKSSNSMRDNYGTHGVDNYYRMVQESYRNPHYLGLRRVLTTFMDQYVAQEKPKRIRVLDLAAGSGEATEILLQWKSARWPSAAPAPASADAADAPPPALAPAPAPAPPPSASPAPPLSSRPPFIPPARRFPQRAVARPTRPSAQPSLPEPELSIVATDPFTAPAYRTRTGLPCSELSFADVAAGQLPPPSRSGPSDGDDAPVEPYDLVIISFALHLVESSSELWALLDELSKRARWLCVTGPHKKPDVKDSWGWRRWDPSGAWKPTDGSERVGGESGDGAEIVLERVRLRLWRSEHNWDVDEA